MGVAADLMSIYAEFQIPSTRTYRWPTNLPFSEWTQVFTEIPDCARHCWTGSRTGHIVETGTESYSFRRTMERRQKKKLRSAESGSRHLPLARLRFTLKRTAKKAAQGSAPPGHAKRKLSGDGAAT